jgi:hypothetical protein
VLEGEGAYDDLTLYAVRARTPDSPGEIVAKVVYPARERQPREEYTDEEFPAAAPIKLLRALRSESGDMCTDYESGHYLSNSLVYDFDGEFTPEVLTELLSHASSHVNPVLTRAQVVVLMNLSSAFATR